MPTLRAFSSADCEEGAGGRGGTRAHLLLPLIIWPLTMHPFRDEAPFLLLM